MDKTPKLVEDWILKAEHDLGMALLAITHQPDFRDSICFHCQQASEKYLKAYLINHNIIFKKTHSLSYLLDLINDQINIPEIIYELAETLEEYGVAIRYPDCNEPSDQDVTDAYRAAIEIKTFILPLI